ncbi:HPF/RaiA family ribosome-associated protein [candidate division WOR-3 bacterium]|nr:HPF/RaiA family ribosome-associated protein [candidate division WOR-3 bacterium]
MKISVTVRNEELKDEYVKMQDKIDKKLDKLTQFAKEIHNAKLIVDKSGVDTLVEISLHSHNKEFYSKALKKNLKESFNSAFVKIQTQMKKEYEKYSSKRHK